MCVNDNIADYIGTFENCVAGLVEGT